MLRCHFEREEQNRTTARGLDPVGEILRIGARRIKRHVGGERCFSHARAAGNDDEIGRLQPAQKRIQIGKARRHAGNLAAARLRFLGAFHGAAQAFGKFDRPFAVARGFGDAIERLLGFLDLRLWRIFDRRFIGRVDNVFAQMDQRTPDEEIVQDTCVIAHIRVSGRCLCKTREIGVTAHFLQSRIRLHRRMQGEGRYHHPAALHRAGHRFIKPLVQRIVEMLALQNRGNPLQRLIVDEDRAEQSLLDFDIVGYVAIGLLFHDGSCSRLSAYWRGLRTEHARGRRIKRVRMRPARQINSCPQLFQSIAAVRPDYAARFARGMCSRPANRIVRSGSSIWSRVRGSASTRLTD